MTAEFDRTVCLFDEEQHVYRINGRRAPGVTETLHAVRLLWDHSLTDPFYRERGTAVHKAIALDVLGRLDESTVDEHVRPYLHRARGVLQTLDAVPLVVEKPMFDPISHYGGCPDILFLARVLSSLVLVDWKTGRTPAADDPTLGMQLDVYGLAAVEIWGKPASDLTLTYLYLASGDEISKPMDDPAVVRERVEASLAAIGDGAFDPTPGRWCTHCDFRSFCDAGQAWLASPEQAGGSSPLR